MFAGRIGRNDRLAAAFGKPEPQLPGIVGPVGNQPSGNGDAVPHLPRANQVVGVAGGDGEGQRPAGLIRQRMDFAGASAPRAADCVAEGPPFAPPAERWALMCVVSIAADETTPLDPVNA